MSDQMIPLPITGGCLCGAVRFAAAAEPVRVRTCWCRVCQYLASGSGSVNAMFRTADVSLTGALTRFQSIADSGNQMVRGFCPKCGTPVTSGSLARPDFVILRVGVMDDPTRFAPMMTIWTESAPKWACIDPVLPVSPGQPPPA